MPVVWIQTFLIVMEENAVSHRRTFAHIVSASGGGGGGPAATGGGSDGDQEGGPLEYYGGKLHDGLDRRRVILLSAKAAKGGMTAVFQEDFLDHLVHNKNHHFHQAHEVLGGMPDGTTPMYFNMDEIHTTTNELGEQEQQPGSVDGRNECSISEKKAKAAALVSAHICTRFMENHLHLFSGAAPGHLVVAVHGYTSEYKTSIHTAVRGIQFHNKGFADAMKQVLSTLPPDLLRNLDLPPIDPDVYGGLQSDKMPGRMFRVAQTTRFMKRAGKSMPAGMLRPAVICVICPNYTADTPPVGEGDDTFVVDAQAFDYKRALPQLTGWKRGADDDRVYVKGVHTGDLAFWQHYHAASSDRVQLAFITCGTLQLGLPTELNCSPAVDISKWLPAIHIQEARAVFGGPATASGSDGNNAGPPPPNTAQQGQGGLAATLIAILSQQSLEAALDAKKNNPEWEARLAPFLRANVFQGEGDVQQAMYRFLYNDEHANAPRASQNAGGTAPAPAANNAGPAVAPPQIAPHGGPLPPPPDIVSLAEVADGHRVSAMRDEHCDSLSQRLLSATAHHLLGANASPRQRLAVGVVNTGVSFIPQVFQGLRIPGQPLAAGLACKLLQDLQQQLGFATGVSKDAPSGDGGGGAVPPAPDLSAVNCPWQTEADVHAAGGGVPEGSSNVCLAGMYFATINVVIKGIVGANPGMPRASNWFASFLVSAKSLGAITAVMSDRGYATADFPTVVNPVFNAAMQDEVRDILYGDDSRKKLFAGSADVVGSGLNPGVVATIFLAMNVIVRDGKQILQIVEKGERVSTFNQIDFVTLTKLVQHVGAKLSTRADCAGLSMFPVKDIKFTGASLPDALLAQVGVIMDHLNLPKPDVWMHAFTDSTGATVVLHIDPSPSVFPTLKWAKDLNKSVWPATLLHVPDQLSAAAFKHNYADDVPPETLLQAAMRAFTILKTLCETAAKWENEAEEESAEVQKIIWPCVMRRLVRMAASLGSAVPLHCLANGLEASGFDMPDLKVSASGFLMAYFGFMMQYDKPFGRDRKGFSADGFSTMLANVSSQGGTGKSYLAKIVAQLMPNGVFVTPSKDPKEMCGLIGATNVIMDEDPPGMSYVDVKQLLTSLADGVRLSSGIRRSKVTPQGQKDQTEINAPPKPYSASNTAWHFAPVGRVLPEFRTTDTTGRRVTTFPAVVPGLLWEKSLKNDNLRQITSLTDVEGSSVIIQVIILKCLAPLAFRIYNRMASGSMTSPALDAYNDALFAEMKHNKLDAAAAVRAVDDMLVEHVASWVGTGNETCPPAEDMKGTVEMLTRARDERIRLLKDSLLRRVKRTNSPLQNALWDRLVVKPNARPPSGVGEKKPRQSTDVTDEDAAS